MVGSRVFLNMIKILIRLKMARFLISVFRNDGKGLVGDWRARGNFQLFSERYYSAVRNVS